MNRNDLRTKWPFIPVVLGILATCLFLVQGGFGGGHGRFDGLIVTLMLPAIAVVEQLPLSEPISSSDFVLVIALPTFLNMAGLLLIDQVVRRRRSRRLRTEYHSES